MELQVGKKYRRRDGGVEEIVKFYEEISHPYISKTNRNWAWDGRWNMQSSEPAPLDLIEEVVEEDAANEPSSGDKYFREVRMHAQLDVYDILEAFSVACPARQHAIKKLLCTGIRGKGDALQDLSEAKDAVQRAIDLEKGRVQ